MILLDTNVCIGILKGHTVLVERLRQYNVDEVKLCSVVKAELYYGALASTRVAENLVNVEHFVQQFASLPFDDICAKAYGNVRAALKSKGQPIGANDMMIAATALAYSAILITHNVREFGRVPELRYEDWEAESTS